MKQLDSGPEAVFRKLTNGLVKVGDCRKIDDTLMVEVVDQTKLGLLVSMARYDEQPNGDRMRRTRIDFLISSVKVITSNLVQDADERIYPISYRRSGLSQEALVIKNGRWNVHLELQTRICCFANQWMLNLSKKQEKL